MEQNNKTNKKVFFLIRGKINTERILLAEGRILYSKRYVETSNFRIKVDKFIHLSARQLKKYMIGERFLPISSERRLKQIARTCYNIDDLNKLLESTKVHAIVNENYIFKSCKALLQTHRLLQEFFVKKHFKDLANIISATTYRGPFKMPKKEFFIRLKSSLLDTYKESLGDETFDDYIKNL